MTNKIKEVKEVELTADEFIKEFKELEKKYGMTIQAHIGQRVITIEDDKAEDK